MKEEVYQELVRRSAHDVDYASYVLLLEACSKTIEEAPVSVEQLESQDKKDLLSETVVRLLEALTRVMPYDELIHYVPRSQRGR